MKKISIFKFWIIYFPFLLKFLTLWISLGPCTSSPSRRQLANYKSNRKPALFSNLTHLLNLKTTNISTKLNIHKNSFNNINKLITTQQTIHCHNPQQKIFQKLKKVTLVKTSSSAPAVPEHCRRRLPLPPSVPPPYPFARVDELSKMSRFPFFNRSNTIHLTPSELSQKPYNLGRSGSLGKFYDSMVKSAENSIRGRMVKKLCNLFDSSKSAPSCDELRPSSRPKSNLSNSKGSDSCTLFRLPEAEDRIVVYFTSLRGIRRTFEDCNAVRMILKGFRVWVDERDVSMDSEYRKELQCVMGEKNVSLPQVFFRGKYVGGADVIKHLFECGELAKLIEGFPKTKPGLVCESCGDVRFVPCFDCSGSRKVFDEDEGLLKRCLECNENGLIRCPNCCS